MLLSAAGASGQTNADSLVNVLEAQELSAVEQLELYLKICHSHYKAFDAEKNLRYAVKGLSLAEKEKDHLMISKFNEYIGYAYSDMSSFDTALVYHEKALDAAMESKNAEQQAGVYINISAVYANQGKYVPALEYALTALPVSERLDDKQKNMSILFNIGALYATLYNYDRAVHYFRQVLALAEQSDGFRLYYKRNVYYELGKIYKDKKEFDEALGYAQASLEASRSAGHKVYEAMNLQLMAQISYNRMPPDYDLALQYAEESVQLSEETGFRGVIVSSWNIISNVYREKKRFKESEEFSFRAWLLDSLNISANINSVATNILYNLAYTNIFLGNKNKSACFLQKYHSAMLQYNDRDFHQALVDMEVKYETEKKEMRIVALEKERQLYIWLDVAGVLLAVALGTALWQKMRNVRKEKQLISSRSVLDGEMGERTRLARDLHDRLGGNLAAIKVSLANNGISMQNVYGRLDGCIEEIRRVAHNLMPASLQFGIKVALQDFAAQFPGVHFHFFGKEKRIGERIEFVIYCCASELVNNSIRHSGAKCINLQLIQGDKYVTLTVSDDGCGFDEKRVAKGFGLKSIRDRVTSCGGNMDIATATGTGTEITVEIKTENTCQGDRRFYFP
jgi:signal transduction histidine kinase